MKNIISIVFIMSSMFFSLYLQAQQAQQVQTNDETNSLTLSNAIKTGNFSLLTQLLQCSIDANQKDAYGDVALMAAISSWNSADPEEKIKYYKMANELINYGAELNIQRFYRPMQYQWQVDNLLAKAIDASNIYAVRLLLRSGADPNISLGEYANDKIYAEEIPMFNVWTSRYTADIYHFDESFGKLIILEMVNAGSQISPALNFFIQYENGSIWDTIQFAKKIVEIRELRRVIRDHLDYNQSYDYIGLPLVYASMQGYVEVVRILLDGGAKVDMTNYDGRTALMAAARWERPAIVKMLINAKADIKIKNSYNCKYPSEYPLNALWETVKPLDTCHESRGFILCRCSKVSSLIFLDLLKAGADVYQKDCEELEDKMPLDYFMERYSSDHDNPLKMDKEMVTLLINAGVNLNVQDHEKVTLLMKSVDMCANTISGCGFFNDLIKAKVKLNLQNNDGDTAIMLATRFGHIKMVETLIDAGADLKLKNSKDQDVLVVALESKNGKKVIKYLQKILKEKGLAK